MFTPFHTFHLLFRVNKITDKNSVHSETSPSPASSLTFTLRKTLHDNSTLSSQINLYGCHCLLVWCILFLCMGVQATKHRGNEAKQQWRANTSLKIQWNVCFYFHTFVLFLYVNHFIFTSINALSVLFRPCRHTFVSCLLYIFYKLVSVGE